MDRLERTDEVIQICERDHWRCQNCSKPARWKGTPQLAHLIANTVANRKKYGSSVIDHPLNRKLTCCLYCNGRMNIGNNPGKAEELADKIRDEMLKE